MARKYSREVQDTALHKATVMGMPLKQVADEAGVSLTTLRRWLKSQTVSAGQADVAPETVPAPSGDVRVLLLDQEDISPKIERILRNEGFQPLFTDLARHPLGQTLSGVCPWLIQTRVFELPQAGVTRLVNLIERSGKDIPLVFIAADGVQVAGGSPVDHEVVAEHQLDTLSCVIDRLHARQSQRVQMRECRLHFEQLQRCCYQVFDAAANPIAILRGTGHLYANPAYMRLYGYADFTALTAAGAAGLLAGPEAASIAAVLARVDAGAAPAAIELRTGDLPGAAGARRMRAGLTSFPGISRGVQVILQPLEAQPETLPATDVPNGFIARPAWLQALHSFAAARDHDPAALLYIRLSGLDLIQTAIGYAHCDTLLDELCILMRTLFPEQSLLARFESNVIVGLVPGGDPDAWFALANSLYAAISERPFRFSGQTVRLRPAIGVCSLEGRCKDNERFIGWAAEAAARAGQHGGVGVHEMASSACTDEEHALWAERVARALKDDDLFSIVYQPIVNLNGATDACYEALLRLNNDGGEVLPGKFLPAAQQAGLMGVIDHWVIRHTAQVIRTEAARGRRITMFVNIARDTLLSEDFCAWLARLIDGSQIDPRSFVFEVPEAEVLLYGSRCRPVLDGIRALGCALALDHFVGREESFSLLRGIDVEFVKLDAALIRGLTEGHAGRERVAGLAKNIGALGRKSIAGRVQDAESVALLWKCGVDYVQGYFLQQPSRALEYDFLNGDYEVTVSGKF